MTNANSHTMITTEHHFTVPNKCDMSDLGLALAWASAKADELGISTSFDDWAEIRTDEDGMAIVVTESTRKAAPSS